MMTSWKKYYLGWQFFGVPDHWIKHLPHYQDGEVKEKQKDNHKHQLIILDHLWEDNQ